MYKYLKMIVIALAVVIVITGAAIPILASASGDAQQSNVAEETVIPETEETADTLITVQADSQTKSSKALAAAIAVGVAAAAGAIGMAFAISKSVEGTARQPEAGGKIQTMLMLGLVFIETAIIYALIVAILIIFVL